MNPTTSTTRTGVRGWGPAILTAAPIAAGIGAFLAWRNPDLPFWAALAAFAAATWPILAAALQLLWFDRDATNTDLDKQVQSVEHAWHQEAAATAFYTLIGGLIAVDLVGGVAKIGWLSPIGLPHVLILGLGTYALSFLSLRSRQS